jgi:SAM-dependent methyltransferase
VGERNLAALVRLLLTLFLVGYVSNVYFFEGRRTVWAARNFYGPLKVIETGRGEGHMLTLLNGMISHGSQFTSERLRRKATTYYGPRSGGALALQMPPEGGKRVGLVGLGPGTLAAYGRRGDTFRFYEINPLVIRAAREKFTYLSDCEARVEIVPGDARLALESEPDQHFDVLILDAFSGDSIPVHLLTREAFQLYYKHLKPDGILAAHVSNRYLNLAPLLAKTANETGRASITIVSPGDPLDGTHRATWVLISADRRRLEGPAFRRFAVETVVPERLRVWTDDYCNVLSVLR